MVFVIRTHRWLLAAALAASVAPSYAQEQRFDARQVLQAARVGTYSRPLEVREQRASHCPSRHRHQARVREFRARGRKQP